MTWDDLDFYFGREPITKPYYLTTQLRERRTPILVDRSLESIFRITKLQMVMVVPRGQRKGVVCGPPPIPKTLQPNEIEKTDHDVGCIGGSGRGDGIRKWIGGYYGSYVAGDGTPRFGYEVGACGGRYHWFDRWC